ncbi:MAG: AAA family ATPase, partial [Clostridia bacterium]|nr:AAA family ATPase [Clostridia bacterium]
MLSKLYIENIAVIERAEIDFSQGFNVLTGETGAGKSILVDSIMAVLGERTSRELVRTGATSAYVSAEFTDIGSAAMQDLAAQGVSPEDGSVILGREIKTDGRGVFRINGRPVSGSTLRAVG